MSIITKGARVQTLANVVGTPRPLFVYDQEIQVLDSPLEVELLDGAIEVRFDCATGGSVLASIASFDIKRHDLRPSIRISVTNASDGSAYDLTGATATFLMYDCDGNMKVTAAAAIEAPATDGILRYDWIAGDTDTEGEWLAEFEVDFGGGDKITFPNNGVLTVRIYEDLNDA